jgi:hypothetical protein
MAKYASVLNGKGVTQMEKTKVTFTIDMVLFIIFLMLKLDGIIDWKWIWIFSPFWIAWCIQVCVCIVAVIVNAIADWQPKNMYRAPSGDPLVWDAKTGTLYGPWDGEDNTNEEV